MQRFKNILVAIDSQRSNEMLLARAVELAQRNQARLTVVDVVAEAVAESLRSSESPPASSSATSINIIEELPGEEMAAGIEAGKSGSAEAGQVVRVPTAGSIQEFIIETETQTVEQAVAMVRQAGIEVSGRVLAGTPFLEIIRQVLSHGHDLIMIMAEGSGGLREILFGSTTMHLMRKSPCPVWVLKPTQARSYRRILAAVNPDPQHENQDALNRKIMDLATSLASMEESELLILHTWSVAMESVLRGKRSGLDRQEVDRLVQQTREAHRQYLLNLLADYPMAQIKQQVYLVKGEAAEVISNMARRQIDLIVMGTVGRTGVAGLLMGDTAEKVLRQVDCAVMAIKPDGFVSPVQQT